MSIYPGLQKTAQRLLTEYGQAVQLQRKTSSYDPVTGAETVTKTEQLQGTGILDDYGAEQVDGTLIKIGDKKATVSFSEHSTKPWLSDKLVVGGATYQIVNIRALSPAGVVLLYVLQVRL